MATCFPSVAPIHCWKFRIFPKSLLQSNLPFLEVTSSKHHVRFPILRWFFLYFKNCAFSNMMWPLSDCCETPGAKYQSVTANLSSTEICCQKVVFCFCMSSWSKLAKWSKASGVIQKYLQKQKREHYSWY